ncbi:5-oxoprolinase subunit PxpB [Methylobacterium sp. Leaf466]|uniref:5-oxoprolinase subunit PxpB n=1 Tax=Methylobacterium sp. Leaf466 TaxID=1736386 RepID=UPI0006F461AF|nr:5-oxoprolinase subunit PxpB [Methylobacterium sp. Leaf466]KQT90405.1 allophanate hydrolase [Methylobacterium sp. Leaf466]
MEGPDARLLWCGDTAFTITFGDSIDDALTSRVLALDGLLKEVALPGLVEVVPTYRSLTVHLDPIAVDPARLAADVLALAGRCTTASRPTRIWRIPVVYGGAFGVDLDAVAQRHGLTPEAVIACHASGDYRVAMLGFLPGYAYLSGLDPRLALPRRENPRSATPAGTISIGGAQALVASIAAPSGWHLLGRTPVRTFRPEADPIFLFEPGDRVRFVPIDPDRWDDLDRAEEAGDCVAESISA